ncbi:MAG: glucose-6-phosphate isomerase [Nitrospinae bacterium]|nr:glucose-6-phosphate isomerase [Nitrospinota bacterium]
MTHITLNTENVKSVVSDQEIAALQSEIDRLHVDLEQGRGAGSDYLGWLHLPSKTTASEMDAIESAKCEIADRCNAFVCIGIGGSYLGARAAISFLSPAFGNPSGPEIYFAGQNMSSNYHADLLECLADKDVCLNVISKSGTTTEPAIAFRLLRDFMIKKYGREEACKRIVVTTDSEKGALKRLADEEGYRLFAIPDNVGGRFSVLTPVGLFPMAVAGIDIHAVMEGAQQEEEALTATADLAKNPAYRYAAIRHLLFQKGKVIELLASFDPCLEYVSEWWKQLAGESEGKEGRGIFPASVQYTTDLHSLGQWVQEGNRILFETFLQLENQGQSLEIPQGSGDEDGQAYLAGKTLDFVNGKAYKGTAAAHLEGGVPNLVVTLKERSAHSLGQLFYFFQRAVAMTGYLSKVNPFDQPGVEFYKKNMFALLKKPGHEKGK